MALSSCSKLVRDQRLGGTIASSQICLEQKLAALDRGSFHLRSLILRVTKMIIHNTPLAPLISAP
jgi:hypothetical protein